jgi:hypothetical protein
MESASAVPDSSKPPSIADATSADAAARLGQCRATNDFIANRTNACCAAVVKNIK